MLSNLLISSRCLYWTDSWRMW